MILMKTQVYDSFRFLFFRISLMMKTISHVKDHLKSLGLSPRKGKLIYANLLDSGHISAPRSLRGSRKDPVSGYKWKREFEFIIKHRYGIPVKCVASELAKLGRTQRMDASLSGNGLNYNIVTLKGFGSIKFWVVSKGLNILRCSPVYFSL